MEAEPRPIVVLLGAGASRDAGLRLASELTDDLADAFKTDNQALPQRALGLIIGSLAFRRGFEGKAPNSPVDIETVISVAQMLAERAEHPLTAFVANWHSYLDEIAPKGNGSAFLALIRRARSLLTEKLKAPEDGAAVKYLEGAWRISEKMVGNRHPEIFTLNYDLCLEQALKYDRRKYTTGFADGLWSSAEFDKLDLIRVYKLHGSFGWMRDPITGLLYDRDEAMSRPELDIVSSETDDDLIFGADNKFSPRQPYLWMVYRFVEALDRCSSIVTVGYGFRDTHINQAITQAMASDAKKHLIAVGPGIGPANLDGVCSSSYYPERTFFLEEGAKSALFEKDSLLKLLQELKKSHADATPFG